MSLPNYTRAAALPDILKQRLSSWTGPWAR